MSNKSSSLKFKIESILDKTKSYINIKRTIKNIESNLPKIKVNTDTTVAAKHLKNLEKQKTTIKPTIDTTQIISSLKDTQKETKSLFDKFLHGAIGINLVRISIQKVIQAIHQAIQGIQELEIFKTNLQFNLGINNLEANKIMQSYNSMAKELSTTTKEVAKTADELFNIGENISNTNALIKNVQILSKIGMIDSSDAANNLISIMNGYQITANDSIDVIDKLASVNTKASISAGELSEALGLCANIANISGTSIDRLTGYTATVGNITQDSMSAIGKSFNSIYSRMNNLKKGKLIDDETGEDLSNIELILNKLGIQLKDTKNNYRNFDDILDDIGNHWNNYTQSEQNTISNAIAGATQYDKFVVLMNNYSSALKYSELAANSAGVALERYGIYQDSIQAKTNNLQRALEALSTNTISESILGEIVDTTTELVEFIDKFNLLKGTLSGFIIMGTSRMFTSITASIITATKSTTQLTTAMKLLNLERTKKNLQSVGQACIGLSNKQLKLVLSAKGLEHRQRLQILAGKGVEKSLRQQTLATLGFESAEKKAIKSTFSLNGAFTALRVAFISNPVGFVIDCISTLITLTTMLPPLMNIFKKTNYQTKEALDESLSSFESITSELNDMKKELDDCSKHLKELQKLENNHTISIIEKNEMEKLKITNAELERKIALKQAEQALEAQNTLKETKKTYNQTIQELTPTLNSNGNYTYQKLNYADALNEAISIYQNSTQRIILKTKLDKDADSNSEYVSQEDAQQRINVVYPYVESMVNAYEGLIDAGTTLDETQQKEYNNLKNAQNAYLLYSYNILKTKETFEGLNKAQQKNIIFNSLIEHGLSTEEAYAIKQNINDDNLEQYYDIGFNFTEPKSSEYEKLDDYGKAFVKAWLKSIDKTLIYESIINLLPFKKAFNSPDFKDSKEKLLELATSGELSPDTISSTEEYKKLIDQTGLSAEQLEKKIKEFNIDDKSKNIDYLKGVLSNMKAGKTMDISEVSELISKNESLAGSIEKIGDSYTIEESALKSLINSNIEQYNIAIANQTEETKTAIEETQKRIKAYKTEIEAIDLLKDKLSKNADTTNGVKGVFWKSLDIFANPLLTSLQERLKKAKSSSKNKKDKLEELLNELDVPLDTDNKNKGSSSSSSQMNFIELLLSNVSKATEKIKKSFEDAFSLKGAKQNLNKALSQIQKEIQTNSSAYAKYMTEANKVGLDKNYVMQIQNGSLNIEDFDTDNDSDSEIYDKIQSYQQWYEKAQACKDTIDNLRESEQGLKESYVDKITEYYGRKTKTYQNKIDSTNGLISMNEDIYGYSSSSLYNKAMKNTSKGISAYRRELSTLQNEQKKVNKTTNPSLWYKYQDAIDEAKGSVDDLAESYLSLAKSKAEASITKRDAKVEKLNDTKSLNDSKIDNAVGYGKKNSIVNNNIDTEKEILNKYKTAKDESTKAFKTEKKESSTKSFKKTLTQSGISKTLIEKANNAVKQGKKIPAKVLNALKKNMSGNKNAENAYKQFLEYNTALDIKDTASSDYAKQKQESKSNIKQDRQQLLDNISEDFDLRIKTIQDKQSLMDAQWDRMEAAGAEKTEQYYKKSIQNSKQENALLQEEREALYKQLTSNKWNKNSKEYKEAASRLNDINVQIQNNTKSQIEWNNTLLNMPIDKLSKALGLLEAINSANKSITEYYKTVRGYSIESDFKNQISDNSKQIEIQKGLYELYAERAAKAANSGSYLGKTYEEWMQEAQNAKGSLYDMEMENESLKDSLRDEVYLKPFEDMVEYAQRAVDKIKDMESLFSTFDFTLYDDNGNLNEYGLIQMKTSFDELSKTKTVLSHIVAEMKKLDELYADPNNGMNATEYQEKKIELEDKYNSTLLESANIMKIVTDMMKEQAQRQIDSIKKQIEAYKNLLSAQKEENSYQKSMKEKTDTISSLQKRLLALGNGDTEATQAEYQNVLNELETAKDDLEETEWEHYIDLQMQALDDLSESLDDYLSNIDITLESILEALNNAKGIVADVDSSQLLNKLLELVGGDKSIFSGSDTTAPPKQSITKTDLQDWANNKIAELYDTHYSKPEGDRSALQAISELQTLLENNDYDGLLNAYNESQGTEYSLSGTDTSAIENKNARILEDVARIIKEHNIGGMGGMVSYFIDNLKQYLSSNNEDDKEKYLKNTSGYIKSGIYYLNTHGGSKEAENIETYLIPYLKDTINLPGFSQGGIVEQVARNGDDGIVSLRAGEAVLTESEIAFLKKLDILQPIIPEFINGLSNLNNSFASANSMQSNSIENVNINLECPAVTKEELYSWLQDTRTQKIIQSSVIDPIMGNGTLGRYQH